MEKIEQQAISAIRVLSAEGVQAANSGHPGLPLGAAPIGYTLFAKAMRYNPKNPTFFNRDRFILSAGHGSMLIYSLLHLFGFGVTKEDLMGFRQLKTRTPGHPEYGHTPGVETTTGPLGQGIANAVGMAMAEKHLAAKFNKPGLDLVDHYTYVLCGDGCLQEGISYEAESLAGTLKLGKLILLYDCNKITIEGSTEQVFNEDIKKRHEAMGWQVLTVNDGEAIESIEAAIKLAKQETEKPSIIMVKTVIGYGSELAGSAETHGAPLGEKGVKALKKNLGWTAKNPFEVPADVQKFYAETVAEIAKSEAAWNRTAKSYKTKFPDEFEEFNSFIKGKPVSLEENDELWKWDKKADATRNTSGKVLNKVADLVPNLIGGAADLAPSTKTFLNEKPMFTPDDASGRNIQFGIREHAMAAICNGLALHGGVIPYCSTFFVFSDYMKNAIRLSALMNLNVTYVLTHDSIGVGEDGPTHQPVEQLISLRSIPGLKVFRPADGRETVAAYTAAINGKGPTAIVCSRQNLPQLDKSGKDALLGGYIVSDSEGEIPQAILMASGSEVGLCLEAKEILKAGGLDVRVVSFPCMELFDEQTLRYRESVLPTACRARIAVEAGSGYSWGKYAGLDGAYITMDTFGASAPADKLFVIYGFTPENVANVTKKTVRAISRSTVTLPKDSAE